MEKRDPPDPTADSSLDQESESVLIPETSEPGFEFEGDDFALAEIPEGDDDSDGLESLPDDFYDLAGRPADHDESGKQPFLDLPGPGRSDPQGGRASRAASQRGPRIPSQYPESDEEKAESRTAGSSDEISIPDHVLTPTLAAIYHQQGQTRLAVQIYQRLLDKDPENDALREKLEILLEEAQNEPADESAAEQAGLNAESSEIGPRTPRKPGKLARKSPEKKPLKGVKIKKKIREQHAVKRKRRGA